MNMQPDRILNTMKQSRLPVKNGFTLIEVIVALVISSLLIIILLDGLLTAQLASNRADMKTRAIMLSHEKIDSLKDQAGVAPALVGETKGLRWELTETEIATDPRGIYTLVQASITISSDTLPKLYIRKKRYLKKLFDQ